VDEDTLGEYSERREKDFLKETTYKTTKRYHDPEDSWLRSGFNHVSLFRHSKHSTFNTSAIVLGHPNKCKSKTGHRPWNYFTVISVKPFVDWSMVYLTVFHNFAVHRTSNGSIRSPHFKKGRITKFR
jgi:hypothetical protein